MTKIHFLTFKINNNKKKSLKMNKVALKISRMITILRAVWIGCSQMCVLKTSIFKTCILKTSF